jgi:hypothetical protein
MEISAIGIQLIPRFQEIWLTANRQEAIYDYWA